MEKVRPTLGSRTAKEQEQNRTIAVQRFELAACTNRQTDDR